MPMEWENVLILEMIEPFIQIPRYIERKGMKIYVFLVAPAAVLHNERALLSPFEKDSSSSPIFGLIRSGFSSWRSIFRIIWGGFLKKLYLVSGFRVWRRVTEEKRWIA